MYSKFFALVALAAAVVAVPTAGDQNVCNIGSIRCCENVQRADSQTILEQYPFISTLLKVAGNTPVGTNCSPVSIAGGFSGNSCSAQPVCCENNSFNGVVVIGCTPINTNA